MKPVRPAYLIYLAVAVLPVVGACQPATSPANRAAENREAQPGEKPWFVDRAADSGIDFTCRNGEESNYYSILESLGGGVGLLDYNHDGRLDVLLSGGGWFDDGQNIRGSPSRLFRNEGDWKFSDVTEDVGLDTTQFYSHGLAVADYDNDGWSDVLITGYQQMKLFRNLKGKFVDVTDSAGIVTEDEKVHWSTSAAWADLNNDGWLDLFVPQYVDWSFENHPRCPAHVSGQAADVCPPEKFSPLPPKLFLSNGDGTFGQVEDAGLIPGKALGAVMADLDSDGKLDIYVANDALPNHFYHNLGSGRFEEKAAEAGLAYDADGRTNGSMGVDVGDVDGTGQLAVFVANYENEMHCLYRNVGSGIYQCISRPAGITAIGHSYVAFGTGLVDFNRDGLLDLFISNGHVLRHPAAGKREQRPVLFRNDTGSGSSSHARFVDISHQSGKYFQGSYLGRGVGFGDLDDDGRVDAVVSHIGAPAAVLQNITEPAGDWIGIQLEGSAPRDPIGSVVTLRQGDERQTRVLKGGGSYLSTSDPRFVFHISNTKEPIELKVRWPDGKETTLVDDQLSRNQYQLIRQDTDSALSLEPVSGASDRATNSSALHHESS